MSFMKRLPNPLSRLKLWQFGAAVVAVVLTVLVIYALTSQSAGTEDLATSPGQGGIGEVSPARNDAPAVPVQGILTFPNTERLKFGIAGKVAEILVQPNQRVTRGQLLSKLDAVTIALHQRAVAQARFDLDAAEEALEEAREEFSTTPLKRAEFEEEKSTARVALRDIEEELTEFQLRHAQELAAALQDKASGEVALDDAQEVLAEFELREEQEVAQARQVKARGAFALDQAEEALTDFLLAYDQELAKARQDQAQAEIDLDEAEEAEANLIFAIGITIAFDDDAIALLDFFKAGIELAGANLITKNSELARLEEGLKQSELEELQATIVLAQTNLVQAEKDLADLEGPDLLRHAELAAAVEVAQTSLVQAETDLAALLPGPDPLDFAQMEREVASARENLAELTDGPDPLEVELGEAEVAAARETLEEAIEDLEGAFIRAPFDGVVSQVDLSLDDEVTEDSRVIVLVDPTVVEVDGAVDAIDIQWVRAGSRAMVTIEMSPDRELNGTVTRVAAEPRTEGGIVSYPVTIRVAMPEEPNLSLALSRVSAMVLPE